MRKQRAVAVLAVVAIGATLAVGRVEAQAPPAAVEPGELSPEVAAQIAAIQAEKASRTPAEQKVDSNLLYAAREADGGPAVDEAPQLRSTVDPVGGRTLVDIDATVSDDLLAAVRVAGGKVVAAVAGFDAVRASVPVDAVVPLAERSDVRGIRPADEATTNGAPDGDKAGDAMTSSVGVGANEADVTLAADTARSTYGVDGAGVKACVLSDGVSSLAARQASGDLPAVDVLPGQAGTGDEGTAMLELIHDMAPGAELGFATAFTSLASFAQNILDLRTDGCDVIVDDITYYAETTLQDGPIAQAITTVRNDGAVYFTSAGNSGNLPDGTSGTWQGDWDDEQTSASPLPLGLRIHGWGQTGVLYNTITTTGAPINLQWADPVGASANDYDLYLVNSAGNGLVASSTNVQSGSQNPAESVGSSPAGARVVVAKKASAAPRYLVLYTNRGGLTYGTGGGARGHNVSVDAISVAATPASVAFDGASPTGPFPGVHTTANLSERFTSDGPTRQYFTPAGAAITPGNFLAAGGVGRNGVDITASDGTTTTTPGFLRFFGTSAAAPNAAALAVLALQARPTSTPLQIENALGATALDIEAPGFDPVTGAGIVRGPSMLANLGATAKARLVAGSRSVTPQTGDGDAYLEPGETATLTQLLTNAGAATATAVSATLTSDTPNATVTQGSVTYANIAAGATGSPNSAPFRISVSPSCPCGATLPFTLTVTYSGGVGSTLTIPVRIAVGQPTAPVTSAYTGAALAIPDNSTAGVVASINVASSATISSLTATIGGSSCSTTDGSTTVGLAHTYVADLTLVLTSPQGTAVTLMSGAGGSGNNLCQTVFSDAATPEIQAQTQAAAPFTGSFKPASPLAAFAGENPQGTWTLKVLDGQPDDTGILRAFSLQLSSYSCAGPNQAPTGVADTFTTGQGQQLTVAAPGVLGNDTDAESDALTAEQATTPLVGSVSFNANGSFTYTPLAGYRGVDSFFYRPKDASGTGANTKVTINVNGTPTAVAESYTLGRNQPLTINAPGVLGNDTDPEGDALTAVLGAGPAHGGLTLNANGSFTYTPTTGYVGPDSFTYRASDGRTSSALQTVSLSVNAPPTANADSYGATVGSTLNIAAPGVLGNDTDAEGNALTAVLGSGPAKGSLTLNANGSFAYTPNQGASGTDSFTYRAADATGQSGLATVTITLSAANVAPTAVADSYFTPRGTTLTVGAPGVLGNDTDPEGATMTASLVAGPASGSLTLNANGSFTYVPAANTSGTFTFTYKASDGSLSSATQTASIRVNGPPVGVADSYAVAHDTAKVVAAPGVLGNDTDPEGDARTAQLVATVSHGALALSANGGFTYTPATGYQGSDSFTYRALDADGQSAVTTVTLQVAGPGNAAPVALGDEYRVVTGRTVARSAPGVLANDSDPDGASLSAQLVAGPANGTLTLNANGSFSYKPNNGFLGVDSFTYRASDGTAQSDTVTVQLLVISHTAAYVDAIYGDFLERVADEGGMAYWGGRLDRGAETRQSFVLKMSRSNEYSVKVVTRAFNDVLGRNPDPSGRTYWASRVQRGMPISDLVLNLISSNEYLTRSGGTNAGFVDATFQAILGRAPTASERTANVNALNARTKTRLRFASDLYKSVESRQRRARVQFDDLLDRQPTTAELNEWVATLATKADITMAILLGSSAEYYARSAEL